MMSSTRSRRRLKESLNPVRVVGIAFVILIVLITIAAPYLGLPDPTAQDASNALQPVGTAEHLLGTDRFGRDVLSRLVFGARVELVIALGATFLALTLGTLLGLLGGYFRGIVEVLTMRGVDVILAFPPIILALLVVTIYGSGNLTLIVVMGILFAPRFARLAYGQVVSVRSAEYVEAARVFGSGHARTLFGVVLPNVSAPLIVQAPMTLATSILLESGLSYLGLGVAPPTPSWGLMVADGQRDIILHPSLVVAPSLAIVLTILAFGLVGDMMRDWLDPRRGMASQL